MLSKRTTPRPSPPKARNPNRRKLETTQKRQIQVRLQSLKNPKPEERRRCPHLPYNLIGPFSIISSVSPPFHPLLSPFPSLHSLPHFQTSQTSLLLTPPPPLPISTKTTPQTHLNPKPSTPQNLFHIRQNPPQPAHAPHHRVRRPRARGSSTRKRGIRAGTRYRRLGRGALGGVAWSAGTRGAEGWERVAGGCADCEC